MKKIFLLWLFALLVVGKVFSQVGEIRGIVYDKVTGEPVIYSTVVVKGTDRGAICDINGFYSITKLPVGKYTIVCSFIGYDSAKYEFSVKAGDVNQKNFYLQPTGIELKSVEINAEKTKKETRVEVSKVAVTPKEIERIPSIGGQADLAQYLQVLPGVVFTGDQGGQLYIRGGAPIQNKVMLDGMTIYNPFHSIGLFSVFDVDILKNVDVYAGGYPAEYGGRISAMMDVTTRDGNKDRVGGKLGLGTFSSKLSLEGPLQKFEEGKGNSSFLFSGRSSYLDKTAPVLYNYADSNGLPYSFNDFYGKVTFNASGGSKVSFFGFSFNDNVNFENSTKYQWNSAGGGTKFVLLPPQSSTVIDGNFAYSNYEAKQTEVDGEPRYSQINGFDGNVNFTQYPKKDMIKYGFNILGFKTNFSFTNSANRRIIQEDFTTEVAGYFRYNLVLGRWIIDPGFRMHYFASLGEFSPEPRFAFKFLISDKIRFKAASGLYAQNLISAQSDRDVVNLFYGFLAGPEDLPNTFQGKEVQTKLQKAIHAIGGFEFDISKQLELETEVYLKEFTHLTNINRNKIFDNIPSNFNRPEALRTDFIRETGRAYGWDWKVAYDTKPFFLWVVYSLTFVERFDGIESYNPHWDRRHNMNIVSSYHFGKNQSWQINGRWALGSGFPFTKTQGFFENTDFQNGLNTDYTSSNGALGITYGPQNQGRLSYFHRFDLSVQKDYRFSKNQKLSLIASVTNLYDRKNVFYFDRVRFTRVNQLPILPSLGLNMSF